MWTVDRGKYKTIVVADTQQESIAKACPGEPVLRVRRVFRIADCGRRPIGNHQLSPVGA